MDQFLAAYGLFLAQLATLLLILGVVIALIASLRRGGRADGLAVEHLNRRYEDAANVVRRALIGKEQYKKEARARRKERKREQKERGRGKQKPRIFVLDFKGDIRASATSSLREEISAVLGAAADGDRVLVRL